MKQQKGFTLIELIIVIVILGILAVTAAPRFIDIQSDARKETLQGVKAALQGASQLVYAKAAIAGVQNQATNTADVLIAGTAISVVYGYPNGDAVTSSNIGNFVDVDVSTGSQLEVVNSATDDDVFQIKFTSIDITSSTVGCYIEYTNAASNGATPTIAVVDSAC